MLFRQPQLALDEARSDVATTRAAGLALVLPDGRALFLRRSGGKRFNGGAWCFPGGKCEGDEEPVDAAIRETREETGWIKPEDLDVQPRLVSEERFYATIYSTFRLDVNNEFIPDLGDGEHDAYAWAPLDAPPRPTHPGLKKVLPAIAADQVLAQPPLQTTPNSGVPVVIQTHKKKKRAEDAERAAEHRLVLEFDGDFDAAALVRSLHSLGSMGASRAIVVAGDDPENKTSVGWDGDGADKVVSAELDGRDILKEGAADCDMAQDRALACDGRPRLGRLTLALDEDASVRYYDQDGRLHVKVSNISKACVNPYLGREIPGCDELGLDPSKIYYLLRDPDELAKAVPTFNNLPLLDEHVPVTADDHDHDIVVGSLGTDADFDFPYMRNSLVVWTRDAIDGVESKKRRELSAAYRYRPDMTPGVWQATGEKFDGVMRDIVGNHVALVKEGRAGSDVVVGDSAEEVSMADKKKEAGKTASRGALLASTVLAYTTMPYKLAQDQKPATAKDFLGAFDGVTSKNWKEKRPAVVKAISKLIKQRFAMDEGATPDDVTLKLLEMITGKEGGEPDESWDESVSEPQHKAMEAAAHGHSTLGIPEKVGKEFAEKDKGKSFDDGGVEEEICSFLADKLSPEDLELVKGMLAKEDQAEEVAGEPGEDAVLEKSAEDEKDDEEKGAEDEPPPFKGRPNVGGGMDEEKKDMVTKKAMDAAIVAATKAERDRQHRLAQAREEVRPHVGALTIAADAAPEDVYKAALQGLKVDIEGVHPSAYRAMLRMIPVSGSKVETKKTVVAQDAAARDSYNKLFPEADRIGTL